MYLRGAHFAMLQLTNDQDWVGLVATTKYSLSSFATGPSLP
jgi:hypothetical protein